MLKLRFKQMPSLPIAGLLVLIALSSCNYSHPKTTSQALGPRVNGSVVSISYEKVKSAIFVPHCVQCHGQSGGVNLESYAEVFSHARGIEQEALIDRTMPPPNKEPLNDSERALLRSWLDQGMPEFARETPTTPVGNPLPQVSPVPAPNPAPIQLITYAQVAQRVLTPSCVHCHNSQNHRPGMMSLETYAAVKANIELITQEALVEKTMPPQGPLSASDALYLKSWIDQGAPETATPPQVRVTYAQVRDQIFAPSCTGCHGSAGGINLEDYANVKANAALILKEAITEKAMPPQGPLAQDRLDLLKSWLDQGAPEN